MMTKKVWTLQDVSMAWRVRARAREGFLQGALEAMGANCEAACAADIVLMQAMRAGAREANGEPNGQAFEAAARVLRGESAAAPSKNLAIDNQCASRHERDDVSFRCQRDAGHGGPCRTHVGEAFPPPGGAKVWTRDDMADAADLLSGSVKTMSEALVLLGVDRGAADRARTAYLDAKGNGPEVRKGLPFFADEADAMLAVLNGETKVLRCTTLEVDCGGVRLPVTRATITAPSGATVTYERDVMVVSDKAPEPDHERRAREAAAERREYLFEGVQSFGARPPKTLLWPPPWPAPETEDPYKASRIRAIDAASNGGQQNLPPSRTLAEALSRARERRALALGGVRNLTAFAGAIDAATAAAEAAPHGVLCCELCGAAENDAVAERGAVCALAEMVRLPDGRLACEACARGAGAP